MPKNKRTQQFYVEGTCNSRDDVSGFKEKFSDQERRWDNKYMTNDLWNPRQPQDFPPVIRPQHVVKNARPVEIEDTDPNDLTPVVPI